MDRTETTVPTWTVGDRLRKAREEAGISVEGMAYELGLSRTTITNYERRPGKRGVPHTVLRVWADVCGVDFTWLQTGAGTRSRWFSRNQLRLPLEWAS